MADPKSTEPHVDIEMIDGAVVTVDLDGQTPEFFLAILQKTGYFSSQNGTRVIYPAARIKKIFVRTAK
jgi:hypothetical protein